jgi:GTP-binding protein
MSNQLPTVVAIVGRPNVGKSTFFNRIVGRHTAIVEDTPGVTRDRNYGLAHFRGFRFLAVDTGGFEPISEDNLLSQMRTQAQLAVEEADAVILMTSVRDGFNPGDGEIFRFLSRHEKPIFVAVNKVDHDSVSVEAAEFYQLGIDRLYEISAEHTRGLEELFESMNETVPLSFEETEVNEQIRVAIIGKPNAGKSSLINAMLGQQRMVVHDIAGTTRDPVDSLCTFDGKEYLLVDTAGIRRRGKVTQKIETYSIVSALKTMERSDVVLLVIDMVEGVTEQVLRVAGYATERGKAIVIVMNKWDLAPEIDPSIYNLKTISDLGKFRETVVEHVRDKLKFLEFAPIIFVSAKTQKRVHQIYQKIDEVFEQYSRRVQTSDLNTVLNLIVRKHPPPAKSGRPTKVYYGTQIGTKPPAFAFVSNNPDKLNYSYERYFTNQIRYHFGFDGTPLKIFWRDKKQGKKLNDS